jgi:hypothetical protein
MMLAGIEALRIEADDAPPWNSAQEPVVKSCSRVPTARITSASAAM